MSLNVENIMSAMGNQLTQSSTATQASLNDQSANSPEGMLKTQYQLQQYSVMVSMESAVLKTIKDLVMSIIQKF